MSDVSRSRTNCSGFQEATRKRRRIGESPENSDFAAYVQDLKDKIVEMQEKLSSLEEQSEKRQKNLIAAEESIRNIHKAVLEISDWSIGEIGQLREKIVKIGQEHDRKMEYLDTSFYQYEKKMEENETLLKESAENSKNKIEQLESLISVMKTNHKKAMIDVEENQKQSIDLLREELKASEESYRRNLNIKENEIKELKARVESHDEKLESFKLSIQKSFELGMNTIRSDCRQMQGSFVKSENFESMKKELSEQSMTVFNQKLEDIEKIYEEKTQKTIQKFEEIISRRETYDLTINYNPGVVFQEEPYIMSDDCIIPPTQSEFEYQSKCIFCKSEDHESIDCSEFACVDDREMKLTEENRCFKCLDEETDCHKCPREKVVCSNCQFDTTIVEEAYDCHHSILCIFNEQSPLRQARREDENELRSKFGLPPRFPSSSERRSC